LIAQPVIREKLAHMISEVESVSAWLEQIAYMMMKMPYSEQVTHLSGSIALLKLRATRVQLHVTEQACQIFGGRAITRTGMGHIIERLQRSVKFTAILGGSEEILADLAIRQVSKAIPPAKFPKL